MKILLISGHGDGDSGAIGNGYKESDLTIEFVLKLKEYLQSYMEVDVYDVNKNAFSDYVNGLFTIDTNYDYMLEVHFNAFNTSAYGSEIYITTNEKNQTVEEGIMSIMEEYFVNRGVKVNNFSVIKRVKDLGISSALLEVCFIDNKNDMTIYQNNKDSIINNVAQAIKNGFGVEEKVVLLSVDQVAQEVINGLWSNGDTRKELLENAGYDYTTIQARVNELIIGTNLTIIAQEVINGLWGNGEERKTKLTAAGYNYDDVQALVNEIVK